MPSFILINDIVNFNINKTWVITCESNNTKYFVHMWGFFSTIVGDS